MKTLCFSLTLNLVFCNDLAAMAIFCSSCTCSQNKGSFPHYKGIFFRSSWSAFIGPGVSKSDGVWSVSGEVSWAPSWPVCFHLPGCSLASQLLAAVPSQTCSLFLAPEPSSYLHCVCGVQRCFPTGSQEVPRLPAALAGGRLRSCSQLIWGITPQPSPCACSWGGCRAVTARPGAADELW